MRTNTIAPAPLSILSNKKGLLQASVTAENSNDSNKVEDKTVTAVSHTKEMASSETRSTAKNNITESLSLVETGERGKDQEEPLHGDGNELSSDVDVDARPGDSGSGNADGKVQLLQQQTNSRHSSDLTTSPPRLRSSPSNCSSSKSGSSTKLFIEQNNNEIKRKEQELPKHGKAEDVPTTDCSGDYINGSNILSITSTILPVVPQSYLDEAQHNMNINESHHTSNTHTSVNSANSANTNHTNSSNYHKQHKQRPRLSSTSSSNSVSSVVSAKSTVSSRRVLFKTLYECPIQNSPLYKQQDRLSYHGGGSGGGGGGGGGGGHNQNHIHQLKNNFGGVGGTLIPLPSEISLRSFSNDNNNENNNDVSTTSIDGIMSHDRTSTISCDDDYESINSDKSEQHKEEDSDTDTDFSPSLRHDRKEMTLIPISSINPKELVIPAFSRHSPTSIITRKSRDNNSNNLLETTSHHSAQWNQQRQLTSILRNSQENMLDTVPVKEGGAKDDSDNHATSTTSTESVTITNINIENNFVEQELRRLDISTHTLGKKLKLLDFSASSFLANTTRNRNSNSNNNHNANTEHLVAGNKLFRKSQSDSCLQSLQAQLQFTDCSVPKDCSTCPSNKVFELNENLKICPQDSITDLKTRSPRRVCKTVNLYDAHQQVKSICQQTAANHITRHISHEEIEREKRIRFDPRVWVHEIQCPPVDKMWYNQCDMNRFKTEAVLRIRKWSSRTRRRNSLGSTTMMSTGTGRIVSLEKRNSTHDDLTSNNEFHKGGNKVLYTNPALSCEADDDDEDVTNLARLISMRQNALSNELKKVLIIDSHDIFLRLLSKGIKLMLPHVDIVTACTVEHGYREIEKSNLSRKGNNEEQYSHGFDLILVEERLKPHMQDNNRQHIQNDQPAWNGSSLIAKITNDIDRLPFVEKHSKRHPLIIGISAYLDNDRRRLEESGADVVWGKPPPSMDNEMKMSLLKKIMLKRSRPDTDILF